MRSAILFRSSCFDLQSNHISIIPKQYIAGREITLKATGVGFGFLILRVCDTSEVKGPTALLEMPGRYGHSTYDGSRAPVGRFRQT
jgi:hypothetical protein